MVRLKWDNPDRHAHIERLSKQPIDPKTGTPGGLDPDDAPLPVDRDMRFWVFLDHELAGARNDSGFADPVSIDHVLNEYREEAIEWFQARGIQLDSEKEAMREARMILSNLSLGRAEASDEWQTERRSERQKNSKSRKPSRRPRPSRRR